MPDGREPAPRTTEARCCDLPNQKTFGCRISVRISSWCCFSRVATPVCEIYQRQHVNPSLSERSRIEDKSRFKKRRQDADNGMMEQAVAYRRFVNILPLRSRTTKCGTAHVDSCFWSGPYETEIFSRWAPKTAMSCLRLALLKLCPR